MLSHPQPSTIDRLSSLLDRFRVRAHLFHSGVLCGVQRFDASAGHGYLHVLRRGSLEVTHPARSGAPKRVQLDQPTLLFYPRPLTHLFHNPPVDGSDFTCARIEFDGGAAHPIARALPPLVVLPLDAVDGLDASLALLFAEADQARCGQRLLVDRLFEVVLIQLFRWLLNHPDQAGVQLGLVNGLAEPRLSRALVAIHEAPGQPWSLERMAECAGMSRTSFALTFKSVMGQTPADYLSDWRIALAKAGLEQGRPIKMLAHELGYANSSALSRLFAARTGLSPRDWLKRTEAGAAVRPD